NEGDYFKAVQDKVQSETISKVLYPSESAAAGRELRLVQEYFLVACAVRDMVRTYQRRSEEHTSELQSRFDLVCRLLLEKKYYTYPIPNAQLPYADEYPHEAVGIDSVFSYAARSVR